MIQIVIHGRGGQGAVKAAQLLALAASLEGKYSQAFPSFGVERTGAPVEAYCRIDNKPILIRSQVYEADYAIVLDSSLMRVKEIEAKRIIVNSTNKHRDDFDATSIALKIFGKPITSTAMLAAFACFTGIIKKESLIKACKDSFSEELARKNIIVVEEVYKKLEK
jgi:2-oxoacid:acceptor oxidoreductase gamma subunit (pyruvate/2-ketoisovalerate family)